MAVLDSKLGHHSEYGLEAQFVPISDLRGMGPKSGTKEGRNPGTKRQAAAVPLGTRMISKFFRKAD